VSPWHDVIVAPSNSKRLREVRDAISIVKGKLGSLNWGQWTDFERRTLRAHLDLEIGAAAWFEDRRLLGLKYLLRSLWHRPRVRSAVEEFWTRSSKIPPDVQTIYDSILSEPAPQPCTISTRLANKTLGK
jgi:hypothetical protein